MDRFKQFAQRMVELFHGSVGWGIVSDLCVSYLRLKLLRSDPWSPKGGTQSLTNVHQSYVATIDANFELPVSHTSPGQPTFAGPRSS